MLEFNEETHRYTLDGKELISVTTLLKKHGLAPDYSAVSEEVLKAAANKGTIVHQEIEDWIKTGEIGFTPELTSFQNFIRNNKIEVVECETMVNNDIVAGRLDLIIKWNGTLMLIDNKTTSTVHKDPVSWQLSVYNYLSPRKCDKAGVFHFLKDGTMEFVPINFKPLEKVMKLMECERNGNLYQEDTSVINVNFLAKIEEAQRLIIEANKLKEQAEANMETVKEAVMQAMEQNGISKYEDDTLRITYVAAYSKTSIDSTKLKKEMPEVAEKYQKVTNVKATLKFELKEEK